MCLFRHQRNKEMNESGYVGLFCALPKIVMPNGSDGSKADMPGDQPQHATRMLTVGEPIKVKAGFDFSAAASSASSAISTAKTSWSLRSVASILSFIGTSMSSAVGEATLANRDRQGKAAARL